MASGETLYRVGCYVELMAKTRRPHRLELYQHAVQQPGAAVALLDRVYRKFNDGEGPALLREDFAGTCAVAAAWCESHPERQAMAVERHGPTLRWAACRVGEVEDLHLIEADVMAVASPRVDVTAALNFSTLTYHTEDDLLAYLRHARKGLRPGGVLVVDLFGGPGAQRIGVEDRPADGFVYHWEQRAFDAVSHRIDCRVHFTLDDGHQVRSAFRYDWRLWTLPELTRLMGKAGFETVQVWAEGGGAGGKSFVGKRASHKDSGGGGRIGPVKQLSGQAVGEDWVVYVVGQR